MTGINIGKLPHLENGRVSFFEGYSPELIHATTHTETIKGKAKCLCCLHSVSTYVQKPGSPYVCCLSCWTLEGAAIRYSRVGGRYS